MEEMTEKKLLADRRVVEEISRHLWIESEKAGYDIGFETAAEDWLRRFSSAWLEYHLPKMKNPFLRKNPSRNSHTLKEAIPSRPKMKSSLKGAAGG